VLIGAEYQETNFRYTNEGNLSEFDVNNINNPVYGVTPVVEPTNDVYLPFISKIRRYGVYFQDQLMLMQEKLHVLIGFRYGNTQQGNDYLENELAGTDYEGYKDDLVDKNVFSPRIGLVYKPVNWASIYGSYSQGFEINPPDLFALNYAEFSTPPATISSQVEFGTKANLFKEKLGLTLSIFQIDKKNPYGFVYLDPENPNFDEYNVYYDGHHRSQGIEIDIDGKIIPQLSLTMGAAYTKTKVMKGLSVGFGAFFKDKFFSGINNNKDLEIPASYTLDAAVGYKYKQFGVQVNVSNFTNQVNYSNPWIFNLFEVRPLRRTVVTLTYKLDKKGRR
jgi:iron complex outermembrane receptor protein